MRGENKYRQVTDCNLFFFHTNHTWFLYHMYIKLLRTTNKTKLMDLRCDIWWKRTTHKKWWSFNFMQSFLSLVFVRWCSYMSGKIMRTLLFRWFHVGQTNILFFSSVACLKMVQSCIETFSLLIIPIKYTSFHINH